MEQLNPCTTTTTKPVLHDKRSPSTATKTQGSQKINKQANKIPLKKKNLSWDFPGGPVTETPRSQCRGLGFDP